MLIIRGTKKLRDRVKGPLAPADDASTTVLGDWFATTLFWKPQLALLVNERTFVPVFMPLAPAATLLDRIPTAIESVRTRTRRHHRRASGGREDGERLTNGGAVQRGDGCGDRDPRHPYAPDSSRFSAVRGRTSHCRSALFATLR